LKSILLKGEDIMSKKLTAAQLRMAALGNNMMEVGAEIYRNPEVTDKIKKNLSKKEQK
jgi:hypothetical protein